VFVEALPVDTTVNCDAVPTAITLTATDNCNSASVNYQESTTAGNCANAYTLTRTWTATDDCGNVLTHVQTVTVQDTTAPLFVEVLPIDTTVNCDAIPAAVTLTATDNCSTAYVNYQESTTAGNCTNTYVLTRTWVATDDCGNTSTHIQTVNVQDTTLPEIISFPADISVDNDSSFCGAVISWTEPQGTDLCGTVDVQSTYSSGDFFDVGVTTVTYTFTDECGNAVDSSFTVTVTDNEDPTVTFNTANYFCASDIVEIDYDVNDNCSIDTIITDFDEQTNFPIGTTTVSVQIIDIHGNTSTTSFDIVVRPLPEIKLNPVFDNCKGGETMLEVHSPKNDLIYDWYLEQTWVNSGPEYLIDKLESDDEGEYIVYATDEYQCVNSDTLEMITEVCDMIIYESFSPNEDGINDYFVIEYLEEYPNTSVRVFNRWGSEVYYNEDYQNNWDGTSQNKLNVGGNELPEGTYFYIIELTDPVSGEAKAYQGYVYIKR
ncbi:gliding motility-associated C-terminal domain-containing protein, partial [Lishizhenia sp.]|uniref:T9SS type B sorting domain-containing protein n=1 Tax=Lishizhenia sp. TaxID=2497594 RepID=UPI00299DC90E